MSGSTIKFRVTAGGNLKGQIRVTGDKSISHRSIMLGSLADGVTTIEGFLEGEDNLATLNAFRMLGVEINGPVKGRVEIHGVGIDGLQAPADVIDLGNSGTSMRLLTGLFAAQQFNTTLTGDKSLVTRPMRRVTDPLTKMGASFTTSESDTPPIEIHGSQRMCGIDYDMPVASAQVKSSLLLAGLYANGQTCITEPAPTRDHTERMLKGFGYSVQVAGNKICLLGGGRLTATNIDVPGDISSATFFIVGACIAEGSELTIKHVGINPTRMGVINILRLMGADITVDNEIDVGGEPVADIHIKYAKLHGIDIPESQVPLAIDEFPAIFIAAACAEGTTVLTGAKELRVKESDRIQAMADGLTILGINAEATEDGIIIGGGHIGRGTVNSHGDHRIAMSFAMAGLCADNEIEILDCENVNTSFPGFADLAKQVGLKLTVQNI